MQNLLNRLKDKDTAAYDALVVMQSENAELRKERDDLIAALKKSDDEYLTLCKECDEIKGALSKMAIYAVELEQRLAGQVPSPAAVEDDE